METMPKNGTQSTMTVNGRMLKDAVREFEREYILEALKSYGNDKRKAALNLGISLSSFYRKISADGVNGGFDKSVGSIAN